MAEESLHALADVRDIRSMMERSTRFISLSVVMSSIALFMPYHGIAFMAGGFGLLHVGYGIAMWNKYG